MKNTQMKTIGGTILFLMSMTITGCNTATVHPAEQHTLSKTPEALEITQTFKLNGITDDDAIPKSEIDDLIVEKLYKVSTKKPFKAYKVVSYHGRMLSAKKHGIEIESTKTAFIITYRVGKEHYASNGDVEKRYAYKKYIMGKKYQDNEENLTITVSYPKNYEVVTVTNGLDTTYELDGFKNSDSDVYEMFKSFSKDYVNLFAGVTEGVNVNRSLVKEGEINSEYDAGSIYANFERKLGKYNWNNGSKVDLGDLKKENTFSLKLGKETIPVNVAVYPYKNGSKVVYKAFVNYKIYTDTGATISIEKVDTIQDELTKIVND